MKTIIIDLPPNLPLNGIGLALRAIADDILIGAVVPVPPFCYCIDTAVGLVTFWDSESDTLRDPPAVDNQAHPPLGTTLADFTVAMLDALPVGSAFGEGEGSANYGDVEKRADGWAGCQGGGPAVDFGSKAWDGTRPLIRVGPEQASEPAPSATLPDPWPGYLVEYDEMGAGWRRAAIMSARPESTFRLSPEVVYSGPSFYCEGSVLVPWTPEYVREVRTPDGATVWKRPAAKVTT